MTGIQETSCRLCLKTVIVKRFEVIDNVIRDILDVLLVKVKFDDESKELLCNACRRKLYAALEFKSICLNTDKTIIPYVDCEKMLQLDMKEVYTKEKGSESMDISDSQKICRLCMKVVKSEFTCIREEELQAIEKLTPEMNINIIKDPVICKPCFDSLCTHNSFLRECLEVEEKLKGTENHIDTSSSDLFVKSESLNSELDINEMEMTMKTECDDIKSEDEERSDTPVQSSDNEPFEKNVCKDAEEEGYKHENGLESKCNTKTKQECKVLCKCDKCIYETRSKSLFEAQCVRHENDSEAYKCELCQYETENKKLLHRHQLRHKDPSQIKMYRCNDCDYEAKYKDNMIRHQLKHKDPLQIQMYRCNNCIYETKYKNVFKQHQLKHKDASQIQMYRCNDCEHETKYKANMKRHQLQHKDPSLVQMYRRNNHNQLQLKHKDPSQIQMYGCNDCHFKTKYKNVIKQHQLKHKDSSQIQMYRCNNCNYETKYKDNIGRHQLKHKDPSQVQMYRCNDCDYETKYKSHIKRHLPQHKNPSQVQMYRSIDCNYEIKYKCHIKKQQWKHKNPSQTKMYKCNDCDYENKYESHIKRSKGKLCKLCFNNVSNGNFTLIDESTREILKTVSLYLDLDNNYKHAVCSNCSVKLYSAFNFKSTCLYLEEKIASYVIPEKVTFVNLREVYLKEHENSFMVKMEDDQKICRLCLQLINEEYVPSYEINLDVIHRYIPQVDFDVTEDPVVCRQCLDSLSIHDTFIRTCLDVQTNVQNICENRTDFEHSNMIINNENDGIGLQMERSIKIEKGLEREEMMIETKEVDVKSEENDWERNSFSCDLYNRDAREIKNESILECGTEVQLSKCESPINVKLHKSEYKNELNNDLKQEVALEQGSSTCRESTSKDSSEACLHKCNMCNYVTTHKSHMKMHQLTHKDPSETEILCINTVSNENFTVVDESTNKILNTVSLNLDLVNHKHVICSTCSIKLYSAFGFKSTCLYVEHKITSYVNPKVSFVNLREVYLKEHENKTSVKLEDDQKICRLCLHLVHEEFVPFCEMKLEMIHRYIPEVNFFITEDPIVCKQCFDSISIHDTFIRTCLDVETQIRNIGHNKITSFEHSDTFNKSENDEKGLGTKERAEGTIKIKKELEAGEMLIKTEEVDIKSEGNDWERDSFFYALHNETSKNKTRHTSEDVGEIKCEYVHRSDTAEFQLSKNEAPFDIPPYNSEYITDINNIVKQETSQGHKESSKCPQLISKGSSGATMYKCDTCTYETKHRGHLRMHQLKHVDPSEIQMYRCGACDYKTKYKDHLKRHEVTHKDPSEIQMYRCDTCGYETKYKQNFKNHNLMHKDSSEIQLFKCDICNYETKFKGKLNRHQLMHKDPSEIQMYKCDMCDHETKYKNHLKRHQLLMHKNPSEIQIYKCDMCSFETKYDRHLKSHQLIHKDSSETQMYKCDTCTYETKHKNRLKIHQLRHKNPSEIKMYKCDLCEYETRYNQNIKKHQLIHKDSSEIQLYKCDSCTYETKHKNRLKEHQLTHKNSFETQMYKCDICTYETKYKQNVKKHQLLHRNPLNSAKVGT
ncbi:uncharacterized protein LOC108915345 [Anoplophora glabripennis]|uniref:uncharacterized protein LOC108915345 n=1 Tax=Anoplophora glabripennis TaxID=217634 RepID=UPI00087558B3|nr:uncharacterized protein LOC108915345 [Anoplophora glabripennis]